jgi:antirestriction protein ArdC
MDSIARIDRVEGYFAGTGASIRHGGTMAYYNVSQDFAQMPPFEAFRDAESFYSILAHETVHYAAFRIMPNRYHRRPAARKEAPSVGIIPRVLSDYRIG